MQISILPLLCPIALVAKSSCGVVSTLNADWNAESRLEHKFGGKIVVAHLVVRAELEVAD